MTDNLRLNIDSYHTAGAEKPLLLSANFSEDILGSDSEQYKVTVEKAEFPIANMDIFLNNKNDLWIRFEGNTDTTVPIIGGFKNIPQFIEAVNKILDDYSPGVDLGSFTYDPTTMLVSYEGNFSGQADNPINTGDLSIYFSPRLRYFLDFMSDGFYNNLNKLQLKPVGENNFIQEVSTSTRMYEFKSIRIFSPGLNLTPYFVYDYEKKTLARTAMLTEIVLNSAMISSGNINILYIPSVFRYSDIRSGGLSIRSISFYAMVHYATGEDVVLSTKPGDYTSLTLAFSLKNKN